MRQFGIGTIALISIWFCFAPYGFAAEIILDNGSRLSGTVRPSDGAIRSSYVIELDGGGVITLARKQVSKVLDPKPEKIRYETSSPSVADTVEAQWNLAEWCREKGLLTERKVHLERVVELDPTHEAARRIMGQVFLGGKWWPSRDSYMLAQGYVRTSTGWKLPQEIEVETTRHNFDLAQKSWYQKIKIWRQWLNGERMMEAKDNFLKIGDPLAVDALKKMLEDEASRNVRILLIRSLANIPSGTAKQELARLAIEDEDQEVRLTCLDFLVEQQSPGVISYFVGQLKSKDNRLVNRAGTALRLMRDMTTVGPLIEAVVTTHKYKVIKQGGDQSMTFNSSGGFGVGGGPTYFNRQLKNFEVLNALIELTSQNFSFDQIAWKFWYAQAIKNKILTAGPWMR